MLSICFNPKGQYIIWVEKEENGQYSVYSTNSVFGVIFLVEMKKMNKICKDCGQVITEDTYKAFNGRCVECDEVNTKERDEIDREEAGEKK